VKLPKIWERCRFKRDGIITTSVWDYYYLVWDYYYLSYSEEEKPLILPRAAFKDEL